jgi:hypothetical protein
VLVIAARSVPEFVVVLVSLLYRLLLVLLGVLVRRAGERDLEIIVLRQQLAILRRGGKRPQYTTLDKALLAAANRPLPAERARPFRSAGRRFTAGTERCSAASGLPLTRSGVRRSQPRYAA